MRGWNGAIETDRNPRTPYISILLPQSLIERSTGTWAIYRNSKRAKIPIPLVAQDSDQIGDAARQGFHMSRKFIDLFCSNWSFCIELGAEGGKSRAIEFRLGVTTEGIAIAPSSRQYRFANLACYRRASMKEWKAFSKHTRFCPGQVQLDSYFPHYGLIHGVELFSFSALSGFVSSEFCDGAAFKLPILGSSNPPPYSDQETNVFTCFLQPPSVDSHRSRSTFQSPRAFIET